MHNHCQYHLFTASSLNMLLNTIYLCKFLHFFDNIETFYSFVRISINER